jgi:hypothetical protein
VSIEEMVRGAVAFTGYPCAKTSYDGDACAYFVFRMDAIPENHADDMPQHDRWLLQLHLFAPFTQNTRALRKQLREAISDAGFTYPAMVDASETVRASDGTEQHLVFEFEVAAGVDE